MQKRKLFFILLGLLPFFLIAQEVRTPLQSMPWMQGHTSVSDVSKPQLKKASISFPWQDHFLKDGKTNSINWLLNSCQIKNRQLVFNAIDSNGSVYAATDAIDQITSEIIDVSTASRQIVIGFNYSSGANWTTNDSLVLFIRNIYGDWEKVWQSPGSAISNTDVMIQPDMARFKSPFFSVRFMAYSADHSTSNTETFLVSKWVLGQEWSLPLYEHMRTLNFPDSTVSRDYYVGPDVRVWSGDTYGYPWGGIALLDGKDFAGQAYNTGGPYGGADTCYSLPFSLMNYTDGDSIHFSFKLKSSKANVTGDSIIIEFKNNLNQWVRMLALPGLRDTATYSTWTFSINNGRFRHSNFQSRFIFKTTYSASSTAAWYLSGFRLNKYTALPFFDDFSASRVRTNNDLWNTNSIFVNNDFPVNQPSLNVATFDGLDANGNAYSKFATKGTCDVLTSRSINLKGLSGADSIILSLYYQYEPQGTTEQVYPDDSLIIELRNSASDQDSFTVIKMIAADDSLLYKFTFFQYAITNPIFFHEDFQLRIRNRGSLTGNLSQWHVDYIRLNKGRKLNDAIKDMALSNTPHLMLGKYSSMPWYQYSANKGAYSNIPDTLRLVNHDNQAYAVDYFRSVMRPENDTMDKFNNILPTIEPLNDSVVKVNKSVVFNTSVTGDSLIFQTKYRIKISGNQNDNVTSNDSISLPLLFSNFLAYDDGTAEGGYGVKNKLNVGVSLKYNVEVPDTLVGIYIFFNQSEKDVSTQRFNLKVWKKISPHFEPALSDVLLYSQEISKPVYTNTLNGFAAFRLTEPIAVKDSFYVGWDQVSSFVLNVGLDKNYPYGVNPNMSYKMDGRWYPTEIPGALMIRPILKKFLGSASGITEPKTIAKEEILVYPNPANNYLMVETPTEDPYTVKVFDLSGQLVASPVLQEKRIDLPELAHGFYIIAFENQRTGSRTAKKILIQP